MISFFYLNEVSITPTKIKAMPSQLVASTGSLRNIFAKTIVQI